MLKRFLAITFGLITLFIILGSKQEIFAQVNCAHPDCGAGSCCWSTRTLDVFRCESDRRGGCARTARRRMTLGCDINPPPNQCETIGRACSSNDDCGLFGDGICGWNRTNCQDWFCGACSKAGCCAAAPACSCEGWIDGACGGGSCSADERQRTRNCDPDGCDSEEDCFVDASCAPPPPSCTLNPGDITLNPGDTLQLPIGVNSVSGSVDNLSAISANAAIASICESGTCPLGQATASDTTPGDGMILNVTAYAPGITTYTVSGDMDDVGNTACGPVPPAPPNDLTGNITVSNTASWWQVVGGDVIAGGLSGIIRSLLPTLITPCTSPSCERYLIRDNPLDNPGVPSAGSGTDYGGGTASSRSWNAVGSAFLASKIPDYATFEARIPAAAAPEEITSSSVNGGVTFENGGTPYGGYYWYKYVGSSSTFTIDPPLDLGGNPIPAQLGDRRVVLFVSNADLRINSKILATPGLGGIYVIVDRNITIDPTVGDTEVTLDLADPDLEGLFYADGQIFTGSDGVAPDDDPQLFVRGSLAGLGMNPNPGDSDGVVFQRKLSDNTNKPGEIIQFAPDLVLSWPPYLSGKNITWREVVP